MSVRRRKGRCVGLKLKRESDIPTPPLSPKKHDGTTSSPSRRHKQPAQTHDDTPNPTPVTPKQPTSVQPTSVTPKQPTSVQPTQVTPKQPTSVQPTSVTPKQPTSVQPTQVTPKQPTSVQPTQVTPKQPISVQPMQVTPKQPSSVTPSHDTPINLSVSYDYHQSFDARDFEGPVKSMEELAGLFKDSPDGLPRVRCFTLWHEDTSPTLPPRKRAKSSTSTCGELGKLQQLATQVQDCLRKRHNDDDQLMECRGKLSLDEDTSNEMAASCGYHGNNTSEDISHVKDVDIPYMEGHCQNFIGHQLESTQIPVGAHHRGHDHIQTSESRGGRDHIQTSESRGGRDHIQTSERPCEGGRPTISVVDDSHSGFRTSDVRDDYMTRQGGERRQDGSCDVRPQDRKRRQDGSCDVRPQDRKRPQDGSCDVRPQDRKRPQDGSCDVRRQDRKRPQDGSCDVRPQGGGKRTCDVRRDSSTSACLTRNKSVAGQDGTVSLPSADTDGSYDDDDGMFWSVAAEAVSTCDSGLLEEDFCDDDAFIDQLLFDGDSLITAPTTSALQLQTATQTRTPHMNLVTASGHGVHHCSSAAVGNAPGYCGNDQKTVNQQRHNTLLCSESEIQRKREQAKIRLSQKQRKLM